MKALNASKKVYQWLRRNFVQDILFKHSADHLIEIVSDFQNGRTGNKTILERGIKIQVQQEMLQKLKDEVEKEKINRQLKLEKLKSEVDSETYLLAERAEKEKSQKQQLQYVQFRNK